MAHFLRIRAVVVASEVENLIARVWYRTGVPKIYKVGLPTITLKLEKENIVKIHPLSQSHVSGPQILIPDYSRCWIFHGKALRGANPWSEDLWPGGSLASQQDDTAVVQCPAGVTPPLLRESEGLQPPPDSRGEKLTRHGRVWAKTPASQEVTLAVAKSAGSHVGQGAALLQSGEVNLGRGEKATSTDQNS